MSVKRLVSFFQSPFLSITLANTRLICRRPSVSGGGRAAENAYGTRAHSTIRSSIVAYVVAGDEIFLPKRTGGRGRKPVRNSRRFLLTIRVNRYVLLCADVAI